MWCQAKVIDQSLTISGLPLHYKVVLPKDYDAAKTYPAILAFPPGGQGADMVQTTLVQNWAGVAQKRGYIVIIPAAPVGRLFHEDGARVFPEFLNKLLADYKIRDNKFHVAGMSNGGISAFFIAASYSSYFTSVTGFPGYLPDASAAQLKVLDGFCIYMHVGELDAPWVGAMQRQAADLQAAGARVNFKIELGEQHVIRTLTGDGSARLFNEIEAGCAAKGEKR
jgi:predicted peptidase